MIPSTFEYVRPGTLAEAIQMIKTDSSIKLLAGGHSLIPAMKLRLNASIILMDISRLSELNFIRDKGKFIGIGAATTHGAIATHKTVTGKIPLLSQTAELIGDVQVRNVGTIGGSIAHADPAADWPAVLIAADATVEVNGAFGERNIPASDFFKGFFYTALGEGEIITEVKVPEPDAATLRCAYEKFAQPASRFALAACAVQMSLVDGKCTNVRVAFNGVGSFAYRATAVEAALEGQAPTADAINLAASRACDNADMVLSDNYASEEYRRHLAGVVCRRALEKALG